MKINISEILSNPSVIKNFKVEPDFEKLKLRRGSYPVSYKEPFLLTVSKAEDKLHVTGETTIRLIIPCDRCLEDVENTFISRLIAVLIPIQSQMALKTWMNLVS